MTDERLHVAVGAKLHEVSQRYTKGRRDLVNILAGSGRPLTIPEILRSKRSLPQSSAYRNLTTLEDAGAVRRLPSTDEFARYELAEDLTEHHHHLVCTSCGEVADYAVTAALERSLQQAEAQIHRATGFEAVAHSLDFIGSCRSCAT
jgi:Fe2+ or Zn2+ uptake regulation protein